METIRVRVRAAVAIAAALALALVGVAAVPQAARASGYLCTEAGCPNGPAWIAARQVNGVWQSYWGQDAGHNCTNYVAWQMIQNGVPRFIGRGDANTWAQQAASHGILVDNVPAVGAIAQWDSYVGGLSVAGHVAYVEAVNGSSVTVAEDAYNGGNQTGPFRWRVIAASNPSHYIHPGGVASPPQPSGLFQVAVWGSTWQNVPTGLNLGSGSPISVVNMNGQTQVMANEGGVLHQIWGDSSGWHDLSTGVAIGAGNRISAVNMGGGWPQVMTTIGGVLYQAWADSSGWHLGNTGQNIGGGSFSAVNMGGGWPQVLSNTNGYFYQTYADSSGWHVMNSGLWLGSPGYPLGAVNNGGPTPLVYVNMGGTLVEVGVRGGSWSAISTGLSAGEHAPVPLAVGAAWPQVMTVQGGVVHQAWGDSSGWHDLSTGMNIGSTEIGAVYLGSGWPQVYALE